jgi:hypothetical protein
VDLACLAFLASTKTKKVSHRANHAWPMKRAKMLVLQNATPVALVKCLKKVVLNVQGVMREKQVQARTVYVSPVPSLDSVPVKRMVKIRNPVYVLLARWVTTKTKRDKQVVFHAFQVSTRMKKDRHRANYAQLMKRAKTLVVQNAILVELVKSQTKVVLNVQSVMREKLVHHVLLASKVSIEPLPWMLIVVHCVALECTKATKDKQVAFHAFLASTRTKKAKQIANRVLRIRFRRAKHERHPVILVPQVVHRLNEALPAPPALLENMRPLTRVSHVQQVTCLTYQTVQYVNSAAQKAQEKAAKQEILLARPAI